MPGTDFKFKVVTRTKGSKRVELKIPFTNFSHFIGKDAPIFVKTSWRTNPVHCKILLVLKLARPKRRKITYKLNVLRRRGENLMCSKKITPEERVKKVNATIGRVALKLFEGPKNNVVSKFLSLKKSFKQ